jgi:hypothetical protein
LADKSSQLVLEALSRASADPAGVPLFSYKTGPGLFGATALARQAAQRCKEQELLRIVRTEARGKVVQEIAAITPKGLDLLLHQSDSRKVLEDLVRALEARATQLADLIAGTRQMQASLDAMRNVAATVLERLQPPAAAGRAVDILKHLETWHADNAAEDCPLPQLFQKRAAAGPGWTIGQFHDVLRRLHDEQRIYLHPWSGPLYALPDPPFALLIGHEIAYYGSLRIEGRL